MIDIDNLKATVAKGLKEYLGCPVIRSNQNVPPPPYPYISYTVITPMSANNGTYGEYEDGIDRKPVTATVSFTALSGKDNESVSLAIRCHNWLSHAGRLYLNDNGVIVQSLTQVSNRDNMLTIEYEYRNGFDAVFWGFDEVENPTGDNTIDSVGFGDSMITPPETNEELIQRLDKRLRGDI